MPNSFFILNRNLHLREKKLARLLTSEFQISASYSFRIIFPSFRYSF